MWHNGNSRHLLPFFDRLWFPYRFLSVAFLGVTWGIGTLLDRVEAWAPRPALRALPLLAVLGTMTEQHPNLAYPLLHGDFTPPPVYTWLRDQGGGLIELPIGFARISVAWQAWHGLPRWGGGRNARRLRGDKGVDEEAGAAERGRRAAGGVGSRRPRGGSGGDPAHGRRASQPELGSGGRAGLRDAAAGAGEVAGKPGTATQVVVPFTRITAKPTNVVVPFTRITSRPTPPMAPLLGPHPVLHVIHPP